MRHEYSSICNIWPSVGVLYLEDSRYDRMSYIERIEKYIILYLDLTKIGILRAVGISRCRRIPPYLARLRQL